jgi:O-antigen/teichoic acid export membrane protein
MNLKRIITRFPAIKDISTLSIAHFIPTLIAASFWFYIASLIGDEAYGELTYYLTIAGIGNTVTLLGTPTALNVYAAKGEQILPVISMITFTISAIGAITVYFIFHNPGAGIHIFTYTIFALITAEFLGRKLFKTYMKIMIIQKLLMISLAITCYHLIGNDGIILGIALSFIPFIILYYKEFKNYKINFKSLKSKKKFILNSYLLDFSRMFSGSIDKILIAPLFGFAILGNYALGMQFYMMFLIIPSIIFQYIVPHDATGNPNILLKKITVFVSVIIAILGLIFSPIIIKIMFPAFVDAVSIVQIIALAAIPGTINYMYISKFLGNLKNKVIVFSSIIFLISISLGMIILGKFYDVQGIAAAFVLASTMESIFLVTMDKFYKFKNETVS